MDPRGARRRRWTIRVALLVVLAGAAWALPGAAAAAPFAERYGVNVRGDVAVAANTLLTCPAAAPGCAEAQAAAGGQNNTFDMQLVDVDGDPSTFDSSSARLAVPAGSTVRFAGLYWGARTDAGAGGAPAPDPAARATARLGTPAAAGVAVAGAITGEGTVVGGAGYQAFADVTGLVRAGGAGVYTLADVQAGTGENAWGGWSLVVVYENPALPARNLTVFDGYQIVSPANPAATLSVSGFQTPASGPVVTRVGVVGYEGDRGFVGDGVRLDGTPLSDALNPADDFFNGTIADGGVDVGGRNPDYANQLGFDADVVHADGILPNGATSATVDLSTTGDEYAAGVVVTAIDLYAPDVRLTATAQDLNGGPTVPGDIVEYRVTATNAGQDAATGLTLTTPVPAGTEVVGGSPTVAAGTLRPGASVTASLSLRVGATTPAGTVLTLQTHASYTGLTLGTPFTGEGPPVAITVSAAPSPPAQPPPPPKASKSIVAHVSVRLRFPAKARGGQRLVYVVHVTNRGPAPARNVTISLALPGGIRPVVLGGMQMTERGFVRSLGRIPARSTRVVRLPVLVDRLASGPDRLAAEVRASNARAATASVRSVLTAFPCPIKVHTATSGRLG
jgi:uncharacterized repeat protein (TIGR01451 family)